MRIQSAIFLSILTIVFFVGLPKQANAQLEIGVYGGGATYQGDLIATKIKEMSKHTHGAYGLHVGYGINENVTLRFVLGKAFLSASDAYAENNDFRVMRNLSFFSDVTEGSLRLEFNLLSYAPMDGGRRFAPYLGAGITMFKFNPQTLYNNQIISLQPIGTEGQTLPDATNKPYSLTKFALPITGGVKFALSDRINLGFDITSNKAFTDYLDDVSGVYADPEALRAAGNTQALELANRGWELTGNPVLLDIGMGRGNDSASDWYLTYTFRMSFNLGGAASGGGRGGRGAQECFKF